MGLFNRKRKPQPVAAVPANHETVLMNHLAQLRLTHLLIRDPNGDWVAYQKDPKRGNWYTWRVLQFLPEVRAERPMPPTFRQAVDDQHRRQAENARWDVPDTFPEGWDA